MATAAQRKKARDLRRIGLSLRQISGEVGASKETVRRWVLDLPVPQNRKKITAEIEFDVIEMRQDGMSYTQIGRAVLKRHGVSIKPDSIGIVCRRHGLGGQRRVLSGSEMARFKCCLKTKTVKQAAKAWGVSYATARRVRADTIARGGSPRVPEYSKETKLRCVEIAKRCGIKRAARMIRAVSGGGPSYSAIRRWSNGRGL